MDINERAREYERHSQQIEAEFAEARAARLQRAAELRAQIDELGMKFFQWVTRHGVKPSRRAFGIGRRIWILYYTRYEASEYSSNRVSCMAVYMGGRVKWTEYRGDEQMALQHMNDAIVAWVARTGFPWND